MLMQTRVREGKLPMQYSTDNTKTMDEGDEALRETLALLQSNPNHHTLVQQIEPQIPSLCKEAIHTMPVERLQHMIQQMTPVLKMSSLLAMLDDSTNDPSLRWMIADAIVSSQRWRDVLMYSTHTSLDSLAKAARCYILALGNSKSRCILTKPQTAGWIIALYDKHVSHHYRVQVATALLNDTTLTPVLRSTALILLPQEFDDTTRSFFKQMCTDEDSAVRHAAFTALRNRNVQETLSLLGELIKPDSLSYIQSDILNHIATYPQREASILLARVALNTSLPLESRSQALQLLSERSQIGEVLLRRIAIVKTAQPVIQVLTARLLGEMGGELSIPELKYLAEQASSPLVQTEALHALARIGYRLRQTVPSSEAIREISRIILHCLDQSHDNVMLKRTIIESLGILADPTHLEVLKTLLYEETASTIIQQWCEQVPQLAELPIDEWQTLPLPSDIRVSLLTTMTEGKTEAECPSSLQEIGEHIATIIRRATARALTNIAHHAGSATQQYIRTILMQAAQQTHHHGEIRHLLACLSEISSDHGLNVLETVIAQTTHHNTPLRWLAIEQFGKQEAVLPFLFDAINQDTMDVFTRGSIVQQLAYHTASHVEEALLQLIQQPDGNVHVRVQAIETLGKWYDTLDRAESLPQPHTQGEQILLTLIQDERVAWTVRNAAARALPANITRETCDTLRAYLQQTPPTNVVEGILTALGHARDYAALPYLLRYAQADQPVVALAALESLGNMHDERIATVLVQIAQNTTRDQSVRLQAVITLLYICGEKYLPFLRSFLDSGMLPLQLRALDELLNHWQTYAQPLILVANKSAPLALRLRALEDVTKQSTHHRILYDLLQDHQEIMQLRVNIAMHLSANPDSETINVLKECISDTQNPPYLRRCCIAAPHQEISQSNSAKIQKTLSLLVDDTSLPEEARVWAILAFSNLCATSGDRNL